MMRGRCLFTVHHVGSYRCDAAQHSTVVQCSTTVLREGGVDI
jgi:hypothetical protein